MARPLLLLCHRRSRGLQDVVPVSLPWFLLRLKLSNVSCWLIVIPCCCSWCPAPEQVGPDSTSKRALQGIFPTSWFLRLIRVRMEGWPHLTSSDETMSCCFGGIVHSFLMFYTGGISLHVQLCYLQSDQTSSSESKAISCPVRREGSFNLQVLFMPLVSYLSRV